MNTRVITDSEIRIGIGKIPGAMADGDWYVTRYSRDLMHDRAVGWYSTYEEACAVSREIIEGSKS